MQNLRKFTQSQMIGKEINKWNVKTIYGNEL